MCLQANLRTYMYVMMSFRPILHKKLVFNCPAKLTGLSNFAVQVD